MTLGFRGNGAFPPAALVRQLGLDADQPLDATALEAAAERLRTFYRGRGFAAAQVEVDEHEQGSRLEVVFHLVEGRRYRVMGVQLEGAAAHSPDALRARLRELLGEDEVEPERDGEDRVRLQAVAVPPVPARRPPPPALAAAEGYEEAAWDRAAEKLVEGFRAEGYLEALYLGSAIELDAAHGTVQVTLRLREGPLTRVGEVRFEGNEALTGAELAGLARLHPGDPLAYARVEETRAAVLRRYASRGRVFARADTVEHVDPETHLARITVRLDEGPEVRVGRILVTGNRRTQDRIVREAIALREGQVFDPEAAARSQSALLDTGVFRSVSLRLQDPDAPAEVKDVVVELTERPYASLTAGIGYSLANGPRTGVEYVRPNVMGRAVELSIRGKVNYPNDALGFRKDLADKKPADRVEGQVDVGFRTARLSVVPFPAAGRANLIGELVHRPAYDLGRVSTIVGLDAGITSRVSSSLQYELEVDDIKRTGAAGNLTQADVERLRFDEGTTTLHAVRGTFTVDLRDNSAHPHQGFLGAAIAEYAHSLGGPGERGLLGLLPGSGIHTNLVKLSATLSGYVPLGGRAVLALSARGGRVFALDPRSRTIVPRRVFLGGASTLRGYGEEQLVQADVRDRLAEEGALCATSPTSAGCTDRGRRIAAGGLPVSEGGEAFVLGKAEVRLPVSGRIELGLFFEGGNLWLDPSRLDLRQLRPNAGVGVRFVTPIGPAALDLGFNLDPDRRINEDTFAPHFTIGLF
jgi:outer membrane protein assembly factor BamA